MPKRKAADQTYAQRNTAANDKFRAELRLEHNNQVNPSRVNDDIAKFRTESYKQALKDAKSA